jgi:S1-C subfamily serine protease
VNLLDLVIVALGISAGVGGYRLGLVARALSWAGMAIGVAVTARFLPDIVDAFDGPDPTGRLFIAVGILLGGAFVGQALGLLVGSRAHLALPPGGRPLDRAGGAVTGLLGVFVAVWLLTPTMADVPGQMAREARNSAIARWVAETAPAPPDPLQTLRRLVGDNQFPRVFNALRPAPDTGPPPASSGLSAAVLDASVASTVKVEGEACGRIQEGSGFVAGPGVVVTNAHVVAGEGGTTLLERSGRRVRATVVHFDPDRDLAVLTADVRETPLAIGSGDVGDRGAVLGYPGGGDLQVSPFEVRQAVTAVGRDLYDKRPTRREVLVLASDLHPGDSGAALVDPSGEVIGVAFAIAPDRPGTAYALAVSELRAALDAPRSSAADTGPCLAS